MNKTGNPIQWTGMTIKELKLTVYRFAMGDCTNGGVSARAHTLYAFTELADAADFSTKQPRLTDRIVIMDNMYGTVRLFPFKPLMEGAWQMHGGNIATVCTGSCFDDTIKERYTQVAMNIMDRTESKAQQNAYD